MPVPCLLSANARTASVNHASVARLRHSACELKPTQNGFDLLIGYDLIKSYKVNFWKWP